LLLASSFSAAADVKVPEFGVYDLELLLFLLLLLLLLLLLWS
jgi:hypothetical protein